MEEDHNECLTTAAETFDEDGNIWPRNKICSGQNQCDSAQMLFQGSVTWNLPRKKTKCLWLKSTPLQAFYQQVLPNWKKYDNAPINTLYLPTSEMWCTMVGQNIRTKAPRHKGV